MDITAATISIPYSKGCLGAHCGHGNTISHRRATGFIARGAVIGSGGRYRDPHQPLRALHRLYRERGVPVLFRLQNRSGDRSGTGVERVLRSGSLPAAGIRGPGRPVRAQRVIPGFAVQLPAPSASLWVRFRDRSPGGSRNHRACMACGLTVATPGPACKNWNRIHAVRLSCFGETRRPVSRLSRN